MTSQLIDRQLLQVISLILLYMYPRVRPVSVPGGRCEVVKYGWEVMWPGDECSPGPALLSGSFISSELNDKYWGEIDRLGDNTTGGAAPLSQLEMMVGIRDLNEPFTSTYRV